MRRIRVPHALGLVLVTAGLTGFGSCSVSPQEVCENRLPDLEAQLTLARATILSEGVPEGLHGDGADRRVASAGSNNAILSEEDRERWSDWAVDRLNETQQYIDALEGESGMAVVRDTLHEVANHLVSFHAYAAAGNFKRMDGSLQKIQDYEKKARDLACTQNR